MKDEELTKLKEFLEKASSFEKNSTNAYRRAIVNYG